MENSSFFSFRQFKKKYNLNKKIWLSACIISACASVQVQANELTELGIMIENAQHFNTTIYSRQKSRCNQKKVFDKLSTGMTSAKKTVTL